MAQKTYQSLMAEAKRLFILAQQTEFDAEELKKREVKEFGLAGYLGYKFESSSELTEEFAEFSRIIRLELKKIAGYELVSYTRGHFYFSCFLKNKITGKLVYLSCNDVRYSQDGWHDHLLIRTAEHDKDYTGGINCFADWESIKANADALTK